MNTPRNAGAKNSCLWLIITLLEKAPRRHNAAWVSKLWPLQASIPRGRAVVNSARRATLIVLQVRSHYVVTKCTGDRLRSSCLQGHEGIALRPSRSPSSASQSSRPTATSCSIWRSQSSASKAANHCRSATRSCGPRLRIACPVWYGGPGKANPTAPHSRVSAVGYPAGFIFSVSVPWNPGHGRVQTASRHGPVSTSEARTVTVCPFSNLCPGRRTSIRAPSRASTSTRSEPPTGSPPAAERSASAKSSGTSSGIRCRLRSCHGRRLLR